jgi:hypothetical protein
MAQAVDGNWYGYFADKVQAIAADATVPAAAQGAGLDFGQIVTATAAKTLNDVDFSDTTGVAVPRQVANVAEDVPVAGDAGILNVVREAKTLNANAAANSPAGTVGQIGIDEAGEWPFIQLYTFSVGGNVVVQYNKGGGVQSTTLTFDTVDQFAGASLDRAVYPQGAQVHATITDLWLNIDPTDEDSWTFGTTGTGNKAAATTNYQVFDENGNQAGDAIAGGVINISGSLGSLMCEDNCVLLTTADVQNKGAVITLQDNDDSFIVNVDGDGDATVDAQNPLDWATAGPDATAATADDNEVGNVPVTITEQGPNSGVFGTYDESDTSAIKITTNAKRGTSASIDYNETGATILVGHSFATIDIQPTDDEWNSGEEIPVVLVDGDANINSRADEDLDLNNPNVKLIPSLSTGDPFTLGEVDLTPDVAYIAFLTNLAIDDGVAYTPATATVDKFSQRMLTTTTSAAVTPDSLLVDTETTVGDLRNTVNDNLTGDFHGFNLLNADLRGFTTGTATVTLVTIPTATSTEILTDGTSTPAFGAGAGALAGTALYTTVATGITSQSLNVLNVVQDSTGTAAGLVGGSFTLAGDAIALGEITGLANAVAGFSDVAGGTVNVIISQDGATTPATATLSGDNDGTLDGADALTITSVGAGFTNGNPVTITEDPILSAVYDPRLSSTDLVGLIITDDNGASARTGTNAIALTSSHLDSSMTV